jgi:hypothetical protein
MMMAGTTVSRLLLSTMPLCEEVGRVGEIELRAEDAAAHTSELEAERRPVPVAHREVQRPADVAAEMGTNEWRDVPFGAGR